MKVSDVLGEAFIAVNLPGKTKTEVLEGLIALIGTSPKVLDLAKVRQAILDREKIMSTGVGKGFAIPHGKTDAVGDMVAAFAVTEHPIDYQSLDNEPVRLMFLLVGRNAMVSPHIKLLSRISRLMNKPDFRAALLATKTSAEVLATFREEESRFLDL